MKRTVMGVVLLAAAGLSAPAWGQAPAPQVVDDCSDHNVVAAHDPQGQRFGVFAGEYGADVQQAQVRVVRTSSAAAVVGSVTLCQQSSAEEVSLSWSVGPAGCRVELRYAVGAVPGTTDRTLRHSCGDTPVSSLDLTGQEARASGRTVSFRVPLQRVPAASAPVFAAGTVWHEVTGAAAASSRFGQPLGVFAGGVGADVSSGYDAASGADYVVEGVTG